MNAIVPVPPVQTTRAQPLRLSAVSFFNTAPLVYGLNRDPNVSLRFAVPSALLDDLMTDQADVALLPVIDYQRANNLRLIRATGIGCDGATLTVRLFSRTPIEQTRTLAVDTDSHTSVALARVILKHRFGLTPEVVPLPHARDVQGETRLLIGDKVVTHEPHDMPHQLDLGQAWKDLTGLPFVFACWTARDGVDVGDLPARLVHALDQGFAHLDDLIRDHAIPRGWPADVARRYLTQHLVFTLADRQFAAIERFHAMAHEIGVIASRRPLAFA
jgi:chorismate dehydratase